MTKLGFSTLSIAWTLTLAACGSGPISMDSLGGETGDTGEESEGGDGDGDPEAHACIDENGLVPGVLRLEPTAARAWVIDDGAEIDLQLEGDNEADWLAGAAAGDFVAVARVDGEYGDQDSVVHGFSRSTGERLWAWDLPGFGVQQLWAADDGWVAGTVSPYLVGDQIGFAMSQTESIALTNHEPLAAPALGYVAVREIDEQGVRRANGWIELDTSTWHPVSPPPMDHYYASVGEDRHTLEYLALIDGTPAFVRARPGEHESIPLPFVQDAEHSSLNVVAFSGRHRVVRYPSFDSAETAAYARVDVEIGEAVLVDPQPPQGWSFFDCYIRDVAVDEGGLLYFELRSDASAGIWAYDVDADEWTRVGLDLGFVDDVHVMTLSPDVFMVGAMAQFQTYCPPTEWAEAPEDALIGDSTHVVRRDPALSMVLPPYTWMALIDPQQRCLAVVGEGGWEVRPLDGSDAVIEMDPGTGNWVWLD